MTATNKSAQPLFYSNPVPLLKDRHEKSGVTSIENFSFAKGSNTLPINMPEFAQLAKHYPIVFSASENPVPIVVLGLENNNLFIDNTGAWEEGTYIPAYIRRYPFAFSASPVGDDQQLILCIDENSDRYVNEAKKSHVRFFDDKKEASPALQNVLRFCEQYHNDNVSTANFTKKLDELGLLVERRISISLGANVPPAELHGFKTIDEEKLRNLDAKTLEEWNKAGLLGFLYYHILSGSNWSNLVDRHLKQTRKAKPAAKVATTKKK